MHRAHGINIDFVNLLLPYGSNLRDSNTIIQDILGHVSQRVHPEAVNGTAPAATIDSIVYQKFKLMGIYNHATKLLKPIANSQTSNRVLACTNKGRGKDLTVNPFISWSFAGVDTSKEHLNVYNFDIFSLSPFPQPTNSAATTVPPPPAGTPPLPPESPPSRIFKY
uniref:Uncharacterized protein n=1 Tax=Pseudo-nitzschia australis TaxID=44445 RepID=A0A7S4APG3_9STRA|eukprot:CAMPEP_0168242836 /NCGR_PEP_ID=MMETSP0140_2-20121125/23676_1 /TAXON_ID=44445 /ORGANISM="Pseudo-nitzschia australis, Strain 10249 10 AB" /LENGTH=165 /DNA_ID=CAMNT_0008178051 /DNA_START=1598 /DNA_END=2095 /DNA_ORIENTATION=+